MDISTWVLGQGWVSPCQGRVGGRREGGRWAQVCFAPLKELLEALPSQFVGQLLWVRLHLHLLWAQGAEEEVGKVGGTLLANSHLQLISTWNTKILNVVNSN